MMFQIESLTTFFSVNLSKIKQLQRNPDPNSFQLKLLLLLSTE